MRQRTYNWNTSGLQRSSIITENVSAKSYVETVIDLLPLPIHVAKRSPERTKMTACTHFQEHVAILRNLWWNFRLIPSVSFVTHQFLTFSMKSKTKTSICGIDKQSEPHLQQKTSFHERCTAKTSPESHGLPRKAMKRFK